MSGRAQQSTPPPRGIGAAPAAATDAALPEPTGPEDERFVYHLEPKALRLLAEHAGGEELARPAVRVADVAEAIDAEERLRRRRRHYREARRRDRRFATVSHCTRGSRRLPLVRLTGQWLREAGFDVGQEYEVEVGEGRLILEAL
jgi:hypothetical protein